jgi:hypothetical protein
MPSIIDRNTAPADLFTISELEVSDDLFVEPLSGQWFTLAAWTKTASRNERGVENVVSRQSLLLAPKEFAHIYDRLEAIGNVIDNLGKPIDSIINEGEHKKYEYAPFHEFKIVFTTVTAEPLVFVRFATSGAGLFINPDLWLFLELEEKTPNSGLWWDPRRGVEALRRYTADEDRLDVVEIRVPYLLKYLQARQLSLVVGHYRHLHLFDPPPKAAKTFVAGEAVLGSPESGAKAIIQSNGIDESFMGDKPFLRRRLDLWFEIKPPAIDIDDPWTDQPSFDPYAFTMSTRAGPVAPARWSHFRHSQGRIFEGVACDFMDRIYFRQEVLIKYEGASGFTVADDGSVSCHHYWGLARSTARLGNELLATAIGDFAEGVPFEEWPHWKQYSVDPPSRETAAALRQEQTVPAAVNKVVTALSELNAAFAAMATSLGATIPDPPWRGSVDSLAGRQLKWVYPTVAGDDEFLKRATLASTLVLDALHPISLRTFLNAVDDKLHLNDETPPRPLGSRNLLQRVTLIAALVETFKPDIAAIPILVKQAEGKSTAGEPDLQAELVGSYRLLRDDFAPLAFLYDLRTHGWLAHHPNMIEAAAAAVRLGLPDKNWHRADYLRLLNLIADSIRRISEHLWNAAQMTSGQKTLM